VGAYANAWHYDGATWTRYDLTSALDEALDGTEKYIVVRGLDFNCTREDDRSDPRML